MILVAALLAPHTAAAQNIEVTIDSDIAEARVYVVGVAQRTGTPVVVPFQTPPGFWKAATNCIGTGPIAVKWASGAEASLINLQLCAKNGTTQHIVFNRPDEPGRDADLTWAARLQQVRREQALAAYQAFFAGLRPLTVPLPAAPIAASTSCKSELRLGVVYTTCEHRAKPYRVERIIQ
jgi:hypothetical protein